MIGFLFALVAIVSQPQPVPADFRAAVLADCQPVVHPGDFVGCEQAHPVKGRDQAFAGLMWVPGDGAMPGDALVPSFVISLSGE